MIHWVLIRVNILELFGMVPLLEDFLKGGSSQLDVTSPGFIFNEGN